MESLNEQAERILEVLRLEDGVKFEVKAKDMLVPQIRRENNDK